MLVACVLCYFLFRERKKGTSRQRDGESQAQCARSQVEMHPLYLISSPQQAQAHCHPLFVEEETDPEQPRDLTFFDRCGQEGAEQRSHSLGSWEEKLSLMWVSLAEGVKESWKRRVSYSAAETSQSHWSRVPRQRFNLCFSLILFFRERGAKTSLKWLL